MCIGSFVLGSNPISGLNFADSKISFDLIKEKLDFLNDEVKTRSFSWVLEDLGKSLLGMSTEEVADSQAVYDQFLSLLENHNEGILLDHSFVAVFKSLWVDYGVQKTLEESKESNNQDSNQRHTEDWLYKPEIAELSQNHLMKVFIL